MPTEPVVAEAGDVGAELEAVPTTADDAPKPKRTTKKAAAEATIAAEAERPAAAKPKAVKPKAAAKPKAEAAAKPKAAKPKAAAKPKRAPRPSRRCCQAEGRGCRQAEADHQEGRRS